MAEVKIPFKAFFRAALLEGRKTATTRTKRYGKPGDVFLAFGARFEILAVSKTTLMAVGETEYKAEGCASPSNFYTIWEQMHPRLHALDEPVYFHVFRRLPGDA